MKAKEIGKKILVIGSMNTDMVVKTARIPAPGETLLGGVFSRFYGGKGANQAVAVKKLFAETAFCAGVGMDDSSDYLSYLKALKVDLSLVKKFKGQNSGVAVIMVDAKGENAISVAPGANLSLSAKNMGEIDFTKFSHVVMQLETSLPTVAKALNLAKKAGCVTILTPAPAQVLPSAMLKDLDFIVPNQHEVLRLQNKKFTDMRAVADSLLKAGVKNVIITLGAKGSVLINADGENYIKAPKVKAVDTVGAGDCFTGSFAAGLRIYKGDILAAMKLATAAAALAVTKMGAQSYASLAQVKKSMRNA